ncbi:ATP synthase F0 subcomplex A subunit [Leeuwenhoekiella aestuarii]|uniref:ATP synthase subunit a n=1 Tax=Leeuwenhoekiella aestuarii TaxID=2249426 RepID=A0A4Q0NV61_9FLAO|nr:F0F1 ATP synthase subunit A [Leeuwenhoekiella aestuarii]RXG11643.1 ATP synthase F0 subcomplex A subunit [Leeuwenhoekiella aestuarii]RXG15146.1 ATP synthase F0 subcomplex A subunit [Leeuwenhoekiella aestuarii]
MELSPDQTIFWQYGFITINLTLVTTWGIMLFLISSSVVVTRKLKTGLQISRWQCFVEMIVTGINDQIKEVGLNKPQEYIGFIGTLFLFIGVSNVCIIFPGYTPPTASLSTTAALALCVFLAVPFYGISKTGILGYLKSYLQPTWIMLPFNLISEVSRTLALAVRLFGNIMSGGMIVAILLSISPFIFPVIMNALGLLTGTVQAYIFSILATVYIAAAVQNTKNKKKPKILNTN